MQAIEVVHNGRSICVAGSAHGEVLGLDVTGNIEGKEPAFLFIGGMNEIDAIRHSHATWIDCLGLAHGDALEFSFVDSPTVSAPVYDVAADSDEHIAEQEWYEGQVKTVEGPPPPLQRVLTSLQFSLALNGKHVVSAKFEGDDEFIAFSVVWNKYRPERFLASLKSFSGSNAWARKDSREWFKSALAVGDSVLLSITA